MFMDELDRIDRHMNTGVILRHLRTSAYHAFSAKSDDWDESPPARRVNRIVTVREDYCGACGAAFANCNEHDRHLRTHEEERARAGASGVVMWVCLRCHEQRFRFADSLAPEKCDHCGYTTFNRGPWQERAA
jgi:hypothetical protein